MKRTVLKVIATIGLTVIGILYTMVMYQFARALGGGQFGSRFFSYLVAGPEGICLPLWTALFGMLPWNRVPKVALAIVSVTLIPALWVIIVLNLEGVQDDFLKSIWRQAKPVVYIFGTMFFLPSFIGLLVGLKGAIAAIKAMSAARNA